MSLKYFKDKGGTTYDLDDNGVTRMSINKSTGAISSTSDFTFTGKTTSQGFVSTSTSYVADGAIDADDGFVLLDASSASTDMTIAAPAAGRLLVISCVSAANSCTVTLTAGTFDGTNDTATFDAAAETLVLFGISATRFVIVENIGAVALS